jgi:hypothetical protein
LAILIFISCVVVIFTGWRRIYWVIAILILIFGWFIPQFTAYRGGSGNLAGLKIAKRQIVGDYETFVIEARDSNELNAWLEENGFQPFPDDSLHMLEYYINSLHCRDRIYILSYFSWLKKRQCL